MSGILTVYNEDGTIKSFMVSEKRPPYETLRQLVRGYIERVQLREVSGKIREAYVDEDGISKGLPFNEQATCMLHERYRGQRLYGPCVMWSPTPKEKKA
jgi:hypothetical protein